MEKYDDLTRDELVRKVKERTNALEKQQQELEKRQMELERQQMELQMQREMLRQTHYELANSRDRYSDLYDFAPLGYVTLDESGVIREINRTGARLLDLERNQLIGRPFVGQIAQEAAPLFFEHLRRCRDADGHVSTELSLLAKEGGTLPVQLDTILVREAEETLYQTGITDVTERKKAEDALGENERLLLTVLEALPVGIWIADRQGQIVYGNPASKQIWACTENDGFKRFKECKQWWHDSGRQIESNECACVRAISKGETSLGQIIDIECFDGSRKTIINSAIPFRDRNNEITRAIILNNDITERVQADNKILRLNRLYAVLTATGQAIVRAIDRETLFGDICRAVVDHGGFRMAWIGLIDEDLRTIRPVAFSGMNEGYLEEVSLFIEEDSGETRPAGSIRYGRSYVCNDFLHDSRNLPWHEAARARGFLSAASVMLELHGKVMGILTLYAQEKDYFDTQMIDLLQQMSADISFALDNLDREARRREAENRYRSLFEESKDVIYIMSANGKLVDVNAAGSELFGYTKEELLALDVTRELYWDPKDRERIRRKLLSRGYVRDFDVRMKNKSGEVLYLLETASVIRNGRGKITGYRGIIHDLTERKRLELQLLQAQKMESIGLLAGGVAHDFNNLLTAISGYGQVIQAQFAGQDEGLSTCIQQIMIAATRATDLTRNLLAFGRKQIINPKPIYINDIIINLSKLLTRVIGEDIEFRTSLASGNPMVLADSNQIEQVLINLATNARDAMPRGGMLSIKTEQVRLDKVKAKRCGLQAGAYTLISVSDTGVGIDKVTRERIFEPFFTTKEVGKGTGLGLSIIYGIIKQHNGAITITSQRGKGSTFLIHLPLLEGGVADVQEQEHSPAPLGKETLLLAEDDDLVGELLKKILEMAGYTVLAASDGEEAVERFLEHREKIALVLCDVVMPRKNGKEVYEEIRQVDPEIKFLFISGYNDDIIHRKGILQEDINFLMKPVSREKLLHKLREILDGGQGSEKTRQEAGMNAASDGESDAYRELPACTL